MAYHNSEDYVAFKENQNRLRAATPEGKTQKALREWAASKTGQNFLIGTMVFAMTCLSFRNQMAEMASKASDSITQVVDKIGNSISGCVKEAENRLTPR